MNLMWFESFWMVSGIFLFLPLCLPFCLVLISTLSFIVPVSSISVSNSLFSVLAFVIFAKGSNSGAFAPFSNWDFEPYDWALWRNPLEFEFLITGSNWHFGTDRWEDYKNPLGLEFLRTSSHWEFEQPWSEVCRSLW